MAAFYLMYTFQNVGLSRSSRSLESGFDVNLLEGNTIFKFFLFLKFSSVFSIDFSYKMDAYDRARS